VPLRVTVMYDQAHAQRCESRFIEGPASLQITYRDVDVMDHATSTT
jgi:hypothetical protein